MKPEWIVVANASLARLLQRGCAGEPLVALDILHHPESRMKGSELGDDRQGFEANDHGASGHHFESHTDVRRKEHLKFAHELAQHLDRALAEGAYGVLTLYASSPFLGELKAALSEAVRARLRESFDRDLTALDLAALERRLREHGS